MGFIVGLIKKIVKLTIYLALLAAIIVCVPNLPPYTSFTRIDLEPLQPSVGALAPNEILNNAEKLYTDKLLGPEAFQLYKGEVYTSLATGEIVKLSPGGHVTFVTKIGQPCKGLKEEHICGRPLGFAFDEKKNLLYVADAYHGIWKVELGTDKKQLLVSPRTEINGRVPKLFNSVALDGNGNLYWTHSTTDYDLKDGAFAMITDPTGRLLQYNAAKNESKVLLDKLWFANGLAVSPDNQFIVVAETCKYKLLKYYINGPKKGQSENFVSGLPGTPDNVRALPDGSGALVALYAAASERDPLLSRSLAAAPLARKLIARLQTLLELAAANLNAVYPHDVLEDLVYDIGHFKSIKSIVPKTAGLLQLDWDGKIVASYFHTQGQFHVSDAVVYGEKLYLGQPHLQNYVAAVPAPPLLKKAFASTVHQKVETPKSAPPKAAAPPKPAEPVKVLTPKPAEVKPPVQKVETPKTTPPTPKPTAPPVKVDTPKPAPPKQQEKKQTLPPATPTPRATPPPATPAETVKTTTPKPVEKKPATPTAAPTKPAQDAPAAKKTEPKPASSPKPSQGKEPVAKPADAKPEASKVKDAPKEIPIKEEIPSDTIKPNKETLKVIKKEGPVEIPHPEL